MPAEVGPQILCSILSFVKKNIKTRACHKQSVHIGTIRYSSNFHLIYSTEFLRLCLALKSTNERKKNGKKNDFLSFGFEYKKYKRKSNIIKINKKLIYF